MRPATPTASPPAAPAGRAGPPEPEPPPEGPPDEEAFFAEPDPEPEPLLSPAERRLRARAALDMAENTVNVSPEQRTRARQITLRNPEQE
jgi:hypothetical protein